ncbi:MAG: ribosome-associated translation inhibitor RaiA [Clostridia bacterium]|nr:ribosome-associated translation inhibitor RaiA [Clostridia bacterium]
MKIIVSGKNMEVTDALRNTVEKKVGKLERYFNPGTEAQVTLSVEKNRHIAEVTIPFDGVILRGEDSTDDMYATIDSVLDKIERQIIKHKTKLERKLRTGAFKYNHPVFSKTYMDEKYEEPVIVKTKRFEMKPMDPEEAILQMNLLGHNFFVFTNAETDGVNVVYKRNDGDYGLIIPDYM